MSASNSSNDKSSNKSKSSDAKSRSISSEYRMLEDYLVNNLRLSFNWKNKIFKKTEITLQINNLLNNEYVSNAWVYRFISDSWDPRESDPYVKADGERGYNMAGYFPEATRNYLLALTLGF